MEGLFEKELKGQNGRIISIVTSQGEEKQVLAAIPRIDGQDITLTIDSSLQELVYDTFRTAKLYRGHESLHWRGSCPGEHSQLR